MSHILSLKTYMSTQRKRSRTAYGRTTLTSQQLVDEMGASQEFPSQELFAVRKCQAAVDAAKQGAIRGRRLSATNNLLNQRPSEEYITSAKPSHSRARSDTFGLLSRTDSFDDAEREYRSEVEILDLELQEKSLELKLAAEIGQMLLEKEQKLSERCQKYETNERRMKTELQGLDDENQILHRKFLAAQKRSKDFQNENFALSEDIRSKEKELLRLSVLAEEGEKMRKNLNLANVQLMTLKNQHRNLEKQTRSSLCQEQERLRVTVAEAAHNSEDSLSVFTNKNFESIGDKVVVHQQISSALKTETLKSHVKEVSSSLAENVLAEDACLHEHCGTTIPRGVVFGARSDTHTIDGNHDAGTYVARSSHANPGDGSAGLDLVLELDQLKREVAENQKSEKKWLNNAKRFEEVICEEREQSEQLRIELGVSKETLRNLLEQVMKLEHEAEENRNIIASLRLTVEEQKHLLEEHEYYESTDDVRVTRKRVAGLENQNSADCNEDNPYICRIDELTALVEQLKLENSSLHDSLQVQASLKSSPRRVQASHRKALSDASILEESNAKPSMSKQLESIKVKLCEKEMAILRYKNIAAEWRRQQKPAFIVETSTECEEDGGLSYTVYKITMVSHDGREHRVKKRFRDFMTFFIELERHLFLTNTVVRLPQIPPKVWGRKRSMSPKVVTERRERLKEFLVIMAALTDSSGEIAEQFWEFLQYKPTPRNLRMLSFSPDESEGALHA